MLFLFVCILGYVAWKETAMNHIIAVPTYGSQRVKDPATKQKVSAHKIGYSGAAAPVLLALFGDKARDVSSPRASYRYIQIDPKVPVMKGYLLLHLTDEEVQTVKNITRSVPYSRVFLWRDDQWRVFPNNRDTEYTTPLGSCPQFDGTGQRAISPSTGEKETAVKGIIVEKSQHNPDKPPWYWLSGDTYPHRELLKRWRCKWSVKRKSWYFIGETLPEMVQQLVDECNAQEEPISEAQQPTYDDGLELIPDWLVKRISAGRDQDDGKDMVYAKLFTPDAEWYLFVRDYVPKDKRIFCYAILNGDLQMAEWGWQTLDDLQQVRGRFNLPMERDTSFMPKPLSEAIEEWKRQRGLSDPSVAVVKLSTNGNTPEVDEESEAEIGIRIIQPPELPENGEMDAVQTAIYNTKQKPPTSTDKATSHPQKGLVSIPHEFCGELTGDISGSVHCFGYAIYDGTLIYLNLSGPRSGVEAIRAKLANGQPVNLHPPDAPSIELAPDNDADGNPNTGRYTAFAQNIPEARYMSMILMHQWMIEPNYNGKSVTFILDTDETTTRAKLRHHIRQLVKCAVFDEWTDYLWTAGQAAMLVRKTRSGGGLTLWTIMLDSEAWARLITGGLAEGIITLPKMLVQSGHQESG
jgi:hypothetical protein